MSHVLAKQYAMGQNLPKVKVVTSVFNGEKYIQEQINSVLQQTYPNIELYIRDNCSTDRTLEILSYPPPPPPPPPPITRTLIIIPAYNEQENILRTIQDVEKNIPAANYVVINDCSNDHTREILRGYQANYLDIPVNLGIGGGVQTGYRYALEQGYDIAVQFDGDGQHDARYIRDLIAPIENGQADVSIGSRFITKEGFQSSAMRRLGINFLSGLIRILCGVKVKDVTSGMRAVNHRMIEEFSRNYAQDYPEPEAILASGLMDARITEVPVQMRERQGGTSSINALRSVYYMIKVSTALVMTRLTAGGRMR